jgi:hypothetical protein
VVESFFCSVKQERNRQRVYPNRDVALADIADDIDTFSTHTRRHSHRGGVGPTSLGHPTSGGHVVRVHKWVTRPSAAW